MPWRVLEVGDRTWNVSLAAERRANAAEWKLVVSFRAVGPERQSFWAPYPLESLSRSMLFAQAERISDDRLVELLRSHLG
jgi:hypothetical protein